MTDVFPYSQEYDMSVKKSTIIPFAVHHLSPFDRKTCSCYYGLLLVIDAMGFYGADDTTTI